MNNDFNITEEEYKAIKAIEDKEDSIKVNNKDIKRVRIYLHILLNRNLLFY